MKSHINVLVERTYQFFFPFLFFNEDILAYKAEGNLKQIVAENTRLVHLQAENMLQLELSQQSLGVCPQDGGGNSLNFYVEKHYRTNFALVWCEWFLSWFQMGGGDIKDKTGFLIMCK